MNDATQIVEVLRENLEIYESLLGIVQAENEELRVGSGPPLQSRFENKKNLLPRLVASLDPLTQSRARWQSTAPAQRSRHPEIGALVRQSQDILMKIIVLDRENEQALLRKGLLPNRELPSVNRQRPHFVADMYRRQGCR